MPCRRSGLMSSSLSSGRLGGGRLGLRTPPSPPTGHGVGPWTAFLRAGPWHPCRARRIAANPCWAVKADGKVPSSGIHRQRLACARQLDRAVEHRCRLHVGVGDFQVGQRPPNFGQQPGPRDATHPRATPASTIVSARSSRADSRSAGIWRLVPLTANIAAQHRMSVFVASIPAQRRVGNVHDGRGRAQAEAAFSRQSSGAHPHDVGRSARLRSTRNCVRLSCARDVFILRPAQPHDSDGQNVPMFENIQYQNQMIRPVPPQAPT